MSDSYDNYHVLIADNEKISRTVMKSTFQKQGFEVSLAENGLKCLEMASLSHPDLIILDAMMPGIDGFEICRRLKADPETEDIPVIFISSLEDKGDILNSFNAGGAEFIPKPIDRQITLAKAKALLTTQQLVKDKNTLLRVNKAVITRLDSLFKDVALNTKIDHVKGELIESTSDLSNMLDRLRENIDEVAATLNSVELSLQFTDRLSQQLNELGNIAGKMHSIMYEGDEETTVHKEEHTLTASVFRKKAQQSEVDDLLNSLNL